MHKSQTNASTEPDHRPKALRYAEKVNAAEQMIVDALPDIIAKLVSMAKDGDTRAARYLVDRIFGRLPQLAHVPAVDKSLPYTSHDWAEDTMRQKQRRDAFWRPLVPTTSHPVSVPGLATPSTADAVIAGIEAEFKRRMGKAEGPPINSNRRR